MFLLPVFGCSRHSVGLDTNQLSSEYDLWQSRCYNPSMSFIDDLDIIKVTLENALL